MANENKTNYGKGFYKIIVIGVMLVLFTIGINYYNHKVEERKAKDIKKAEEVQKVKDEQKAKDIEKADLQKALDEQKAKAEVDKLKAEQKAEAKREKALKLQKRVDFINLTERVMRSQGLDVDCTAYGPGKTIYKIKYIRMSRPFVDQLINEGNSLENLKAMGFAKAIFTDGYDQTWAYDLK
ncbi:MAG: hypothetical protein C0399_00500 [Syntrophus sp. (in: bacteria)]|nr:hypothetical protein [Syntrophus sp. (in: bacteria)]